jgi:hypothetical protein
MSLDDMIAGTQAANNEITDQEELLAQAAEALMGKVGSYNTGLVDGYNEALADRTDFEVKENGTYEPPEGSSGFKKVVANVKAKPIEEKAVNFVDYDGTILYAYEVSEIEEMSTLPELPEHNGLICQGWNWTLDEIKQYIVSFEENGLPFYGMDVGAIYTTDDGATRLVINLTNDSMLRIGVQFGLSNSNAEAEVDWGDGSARESVTGLTDYYKRIWHTYPSKGRYTISLIPVKLNIYISSSNTMSYPNDVMINSWGACALEQVFIGENVTFSPRAFYYSYGLKSVTIPNGGRLEIQGFHYCDSLEHINVPRDSYLSNAFEYTRFKRFTGNPTVSGYSSVRGSTNLKRATLIGTTVKANMFAGCSGLREVNLSQGITSIGESAFASCEGLTELYIPNTVEKIAATAFAYCSSLHILDFSRHTFVPTLANTNALQSIYSSCKIKVPANLAEEWKAATNWSTYADKIIGVEV